MCGWYGIPLQIYTLYLSMAAIITILYFVPFDNYSTLLDIIDVVLESDSVMYIPTTRITTTLSNDCMIVSLTLCTYSDSSYNNN